MIRFDIEDAFQKIGRVSDVWVARKPPGFAFIEMEVRTLFSSLSSTQYFLSSLLQSYRSIQDKRDAEDACRELDGTRICGNRVKVVQTVLIVLNMQKERESE